LLERRSIFAGNHWSLLNQHGHRRAARNWTRRSRWGLPLEIVTSVATLCALAAAVQLA
jgi:hypothetical protein